MNFDLTEEQQLIRETVRAFAEKEVRPLADRLDREGSFPLGLVHKLAELGLMGAFVPSRYGGVTMDLLSFIIAMEEIARVWLSLSVTMGLHNSMICESIARFGSEAQREKYLRDLAAGKILGCYALTEPGAGSDAAGVKTRADRSDGGYVLNGSKVFITNGGQAGFAMVFAVTAPEHGKHGISAFLVEKGTPGFVVGKLEEKLGLRASDTAQLIFEDCRLPVENLLGRENDGLKIALSALDAGRIGVAAQSVGLAQGCLEEALRYAKERKQFGKKIADFQAVQWMIADMTTEIDASRLLTYRAARKRDRGMQVTREAAQAKLFASETANRAAYRVGQIFGGYGYIKGSLAERFYRDARITTIFEGTSEIQRMVIAREELKNSGG
ncbi:MAG: acyl-CoA dehydrogenase family protein [Deltaproteobacteria bacterium]|nr:acyl-CoA dehydrogenase family protein [Deltaproteobacteria bacterium]